MPTYHARRGFASAAAAKRRSANRATVVARKRKTTALNRLKLNPTVAKLVDRRIYRTQERHQTYFHLRRTQLTNMPDTLPRAWKLFPPVSQDTTRSTRLGSELTLTAGYTRGILTVPADDNPPLGNDDRADIMLRLMVVSAKGGDNVDFWNAQYLSDIYANFFKSGDAATGFTGTNIDMWQSINHDIVTTHYDRVFRMKRGVGYFPAATPQSDGAAHMPAIHIPFRIKHRVKGKKIYYRTQVTTSADNYCPVMLAVWSYTNGANPSQSGVPFIESWTNWFYKA